MSLSRGISRYRSAFSLVKNNGAVVQQRKTSDQLFKYHQSESIYWLSIERKWDSSNVGIHQTKLVNQRRLLHTSPVIKII